MVQIAKNCTDGIITEITTINIKGDIPQARNIDKSAGTKKRHLRLSSKMAFFCSYQSETLTAKPPLKK